MAADQRTGGSYIPSAQWNTGFSNSNSRGFSSNGSQSNGFGSSYGNRKSYSNNTNGSSYSSAGPTKEYNVKKQFYVEDPNITAAKPEQVAEFRKTNNNIMVFSTNNNTPIPNPVCNFEQAFRCDPGILTCIQNQGFTQPSPIQCQTWPILLSGHDCIAISQTGSGKTISFLLPALVHAHNQTDPELLNSRSSKILVICPTRELALQTNSECRKYPYKNTKSVCVYGGAPKGPQLNELRMERPQVIVGTPGRVNDFCDAGKLDLSKVTFVVLDEADRMLDMGFEPQIKQILNRLPKNRQTVMTSATWPEEVKSLAREYLQDFIQINIGDLELNAAKTITQTIDCETRSEQDKVEHLIANLSSQAMASQKTLIFCNTKDSVKRLCTTLRHRGFRASMLMGAMDQSQREANLDNLKYGHSQICVCTDVAARGLDLPDIMFVINFDMANSIDEYVHRIGRTGRAGRAGTAITYFNTHTDGAKAAKLIELLKKNDQFINPKLYNCQNYGGRSSGGGFRGGRNNSYSGSRFGGSNFRSSGFTGNSGFKREKSDW